MKQLYLLIVFSFFFSCGSDKRNITENENKETALVVSDSVKNTVSKTESNGINSSSSGSVNTDALNEESKCATHRTPIQEVRAQEFKINNTRDTTLKLKKGSRIFIPASSIVTSKGNKPVIQAMVKVREYLEVEDFILGDLGTITEDARILETGGSIYIDVTSGTEKCQVKKGEVITIGFPVKGKKLEDMKSFEGKEDDKGFVNWELGLGDILRKYDSVKVVTGKAGTRYQQFMDGKMSIEEYIAHNTHLTPNKVPKIPIDNVYISFDINEKGKPADIKITGAEDYLVQNKLTNTIKFMPDWEPFMTRTGIVAPDRPDREYRAIKMGISLQVQVDMVKGKVLFAKDQVAPKGTPFAGEDKEYYVVNSTILGYVNCDRFYNDEREKINVFVDAKTGSDAQAYLVFKDNPAILRNCYSAGKLYFKAIPVGVEAIMVYARKEGDTYYYSCQDVKVSKRPITTENEKKGSESDIALAIRSYYSKNGG